MTLPAKGRLLRCHPGRSATLAHGRRVPAMCLCGRSLRCSAAISSDSSTGCAITNRRGCLSVRPGSRCWRATRALPSGSMSGRRVSPKVRATAPASGIHLVAAAARQQTPIGVGRPTLRAANRDKTFPSQRPWMISHGSPRVPRGTQAVPDRFALTPLSGHVPAYRRTSMTREPVKRP